MAKDKKRGFFSWFGRGRQEEEQQKEETRVEPPVAEAPLSDTPAQEAPPAAEEPREQAAAELAEEIVHITEQVAAQPVAETPVVTEVVTEEPVIEETVAEEPVLVEEQVVEDEFVESAAEIAEDAREDSLDAVDDSLVVEDHVAEEEIVEEEPVEDAPLPVALDPIVVLPAGETEQERPTKEGFFARLKRSLVKTKQNLGSGFVGLFRGKKIDDDLFEELEEQLLIADVGVETTRKIITSLTEHASRKQLKDADALYGKLKEEMSEILSKVDEPLDVSGKTPYVILMVGVNGVGKTTTIGKMARQFEAQGKSVMLAAGDTFRAAAVEQLQVWGQRNKIPVIAQHTGADSASVIFDAIQAAKARNIDVLIADTAGRLQNKAHLMEELKKIVRVMKKLDEDAPHEVMLTLDASTGQNAVSQAKLFNEAVGLTGITLTKLDGTAKGGVIFAIADQFSIPIRYIGVGEGIEDLRPFKADDFIEALFARED
ncbi:signal recognition particle-docking protein FtsY [Rahnella sp. PD12R]|uniref:signal recognition particle-docking protein FtsY n=1 Tax=Rahnella sp. PD12R TaxID=2855688 RepID=UPI001C43BC17|nr:signal recognition particle-docking protein FtsY [Rahnella sp. PD12R]MBV6820398.1 signal recognition particle-docking protein FtsY [Rahnella sp. PD12R]